MSGEDSNGMSSLHEEFQETLLGMSYDRKTSQESFSEVDLRTSPAYRSVRIGCELSSSTVQSTVASDQPASLSTGLKRGG